MVSSKWSTSEDGAIQYVSYSPKEHYDGIIESLHKGFYTNESICRALGIDEDLEAQCELDLLVKEVMKDGVSLVAVEQSTGKVLGAAVSKIQVKTAQGEAFFETFAKTCKQDRSRELINYMVRADGACDLFQHCNVDCLFEFMLLTVHPDFWKRKIGENLTKATIQLARKLSLGENVKVPLDDGEVLSLEPIPKLIACICTSPVSQRLCSNCGFEVVARVWYKDHYFNGKSYASVLEEGNTNTALCFIRF